MFHAHKTEFAEKGWTGMFLVKEPGADAASQGPASAGIE
jgi:hypothetical protein